MGPGWVVKQVSALRSGQKIVPPLEVFACPRGKRTAGSNMVPLELKVVQTAEEGAAKRDDLAAEVEEARELFAGGVRHRVGVESLVHKAECFLSLLLGQASDHRESVNLDAQTLKCRALAILRGVGDEAEEVRKFVPGRDEYGDEKCAVGRDDGNEVVEIVDEEEQRDEQQDKPVQGLGEEVENERSSAQTKGETGFYVVLTLPLETHKPAVSQGNRDQAEGVLEVAFDQNGAAAGASDDAEELQARGVEEMPVRGIDVVVDRIALGI